MARARILVADDVPAWRAQVRTVLLGYADWEIIAEACDGLEAVRHAADLQPDLALLDIGMPSLNGIAAAVEIRKRCPECKIVFLTQDSDPAIRDAALAAGACGYVIKGKAATDLIPTITEALRNGRRGF